MNYFQFFGKKTTSTTAVDPSKTVPLDCKSVMNNLKPLSIFDSLTPNNNKQLMCNTSNSIKMRVSGKGNKSVYSHFPNVFGNGESFTLTFHGLKDFTAQLGKPFIFNKQLVQTNLSGSIDCRKINDKEVESKKLEIIGLFDNFTCKIGAVRIKELSTCYSQLINSFFGFKLDTKIGVTKTEKVIPFCKFIAAKKLSLVGDFGFIESTIKIGRIIGQTTILEKFFIGNTLKGYQKESIGPVNQNKKLGGNSFIEIKNKAGLFIKNFEIFAFGDVGSNSAKGVKECGQLLAEFGDNVCIGKSVGFGCGMKNGKGPSFIFAVPLTTNPEAEPYSFGFDLEL